MELPRTVTLVYLARLREAFGTPGEKIELPSEVRTVSALKGWLATRGGAWASELKGQRAVRIAVNHDVARDETLVTAGDEIAVFPPVTGG